MPTISYILIFLSYYYCCYYYTCYKIIAITVTITIALLLSKLSYYFATKHFAADIKFLGVVELTTQLLIPSNILWLPLCRIYKFGLNTLPSKLLRSPILVGYQVPFHDSMPSFMNLRGVLDLLEFKNQVSQSFAGNQRCPGY